MIIASILCVCVLDMDIRLVLLRVNGTIVVTTIKLVLTDRAKSWHDRTGYELAFNGVHGPNLYSIEWGWVIWLEATTIYQDNY